MNPPCIAYKMYSFIGVLLILGSAVRLPYHQPEKKDLSVFLARTELKQQQFVGTSRLSWKQFVPPTSSLTTVDDSLLTGVVTSVKVASAVPAESSIANDVEAVAEQCVSESDELPDLNSFYSRSETVANNALVSSAAETVAQEQLPSSKSTQRKLLMLSPVKNTHVTSEQFTSLNCEVLEHSENITQDVDASLAPAVGKRLLLDPVDRHDKSIPLTSVVVETAASDAAECTEEGSKVLSVSECIVAELTDGGNVVPEMPQLSAAGKFSSRNSHRVLPSNVPLPQLSGNPNDVIEFDDDSDAGNCQLVDADNKGVEQLMDRLLQHARGSAHARKPKTVEIR